jgi:microcin C transport system substrate-binding protein
VDFHAEYTIKDWMLAYDVPAVKDGRITRSEIDDQAIFGLSGIFLNTRRADLQDIRVREALSLLFDFEWVNRSLFYDAYTRCESYFSGSHRLTAQDVITPLEKSILQTHFGTDSIVLPTMPVSDASGYIRDRLHRAVKLLEEAGYTLKKGVMYKPDGRVFRLNMILSSASLQRIFGAWQRNLARIGIDLKIDFLEQTQYINRLRHFDFDVVYSTIAQSSNPGNEQRDFWGTRARDIVGSRNWAGIADARIDALIEELIAADTAEKHQAYVRVLDRVLRSGHYVIAGWYSQKTRVAHWTDRIVMPPSWKVPERGIDMSVWYKKEGG